MASHGVRSPQTVNAITGSHAIDRSPSKLS